MSDLLNRSERDTMGSIRSTFPNATRPAVEIGEAFGAGLDFAIDVDWTVAEGRIRGKKLNSLIDTYKEVTGKEFPWAELPEVDFKNAEEPLQGTQQRIVSFLTKFIKDNPEAAARFDLDVDQHTLDTFKKSGDEFQEVAGHLAPWAGLGLAAGQFVGNAADPTLLVASALGGATLHVGKGASLLRGVLTEMGIGAVTEAINTPGLANRYEKAGLPFTWQDAVFNVSASAFASGGLYAAGRGISVAGRRALDKARGLTPETRALADWLEHAAVEADGSGRLFKVGDADDATVHLNAIDRTVAALVRGESLPVIPVRVDRLNYSSLTALPDIAERYADGIVDPNLRALVTDEFKALNERMSVELKALEAEVDASVRAEMGIDPDDTNIKFHKTNDGVYEGGKHTIRRLEDKKGWAVFKQDEWDDIYQQDNASSRAAETVVPTLAAAKKHVADVMSENARNSLETYANNLPEARRRKAELSSELLHNQRELMETGAVDVDNVASFNQTSAYPITPMRAIKLQMAKDAVENVELVARKLPEIEKGQLFTARQTVADKDQLVTLTAENGAKVQRNLSALVKEIDEDLNFLDEFFSCRIGGNIG